MRFPGATIRISAGLGVALMLAACTSSPETATTDAPVVDTTEAIECADVIEATVEPSQKGYRVTATVSSADTGWDRYADAWEVRDTTGTVLGTRVLAHPHVDEQPFTRSLDGVEIPAGVVTVEIAAHDSMHGFCGNTVLVDVPRR